MKVLIKPSIGETSEIQDTTVTLLQILSTSAVVKDDVGSIWFVPVEWLWTVK